MRRARVIARDTPKSEAELCDLCADAARADGWDVFPEVAGFDLLLVWRAARPTPTVTMPDGTRLEGFPLGYQMGVDAKLRANTDVLAQCAARMDLGIRPDAAAVLVPEASDVFEAVAHRLGLRVLTLNHCTTDERVQHGYQWERERRRIDPDVAPRFGFFREERKRPLTVPPVPLQSSGGQASPRVLSPWRVAALRLVLLMERAGKLTRADFKAAGVNPARWLDAEWLLSDFKRPATYTPGRRWKAGPHLGYGAELEALRAADAARGAAHA